MFCVKVSFPIVQKEKFPMKSNISPSSIMRSMMFVWVAHFIVDFMLGIWPVYKTMIDLDLAKAGLIMGGCAIIGEGCQPFVGALSDRGYTKWLVILGVLLASTASFLAYTRDYTFLTFLFLLTFMGSGVFHPSAGSLVSRISGERRGLLMSLFASGGAFGLAISQMLFTKAYIAFNGQTICFLIPSLLIVAWAGMRFAAPQGVAAPTMQKKKLGLKGFLQLYRHRELSLLYVLLVCNQGIMWALIFLLPDVLKERAYETWVCYGAGHFAFVIGGALMMVPGGYLADCFSEKNVLLIGSASGALCIFTFLLFPALPALVVLALLFVAGSCLYVMLPVSIALGTRLMPENPGMINAFLMGMVWMVAESCGPGLSGVMTKFFTENHAANALTVMALFFFLEIWCVTRLPGKKAKVPSSEFQVA